MSYTCFMQNEFAMAERDTAAGIKVLPPAVSSGKTVCSFTKGIK